MCIKIASTYYKLVNDKKKKHKYSRLPIIRNRIIRNVGLSEIKIELDFSALSEPKLILSFGYPKRGICCAT
jgi:hypothetical protein